MKLTSRLRGFVVLIATLPVLLPPLSLVPVADAAPRSVSTVSPAYRAKAAALADSQGLSPQVLGKALDAVSCAQARGVSGRADLLTIIDYSLPSTQPRLWVLDLAQRKVLFHELVAHGAGSGDVYATRFSNTDDSRQTSLGLFKTAGTYEGGNGYSLTLQGLDAGINDHAEARHIVMHGAWYVSPEHAHQYGRLGRSWGCPALSLESAPRVIDTIKGGTFVFSYSGDKAWSLAAARTCPVAPAAGGGAMTVAAGG